MELNLSNIVDPKPTERMLEAAKFVEDTLLVDLPEKWKSSFFICSNFLDKYLNKAKEQFIEEREIWEEYYMFEQCDYVSNDSPKEGQRKYYADGICKYDSHNKRYVDAQQYDKTINGYGSYRAADMVHTAQRKANESRINAYWSDWSY